jgi:hypothetical protein
MKTTVVPAQVTTVEDKIAGNLNFTQIILLITALLASTAVYAAVPPSTKFTAVKLALIALQFMVFGGMAIRIKNKLIIEWLIILLRYMLRPRVYVFTKNDMAARDEIVIEIAKEESKVKTCAKRTKHIPETISLKDKAKIENLFDDPSLSYRFEMAKKGGINVSFAPKED